MSGTCSRIARAAVTTTAPAWGEALAFTRAGECSD